LRARWTLRKRTCAASQKHTQAAPNLNAGILAMSY
jgi:hypothetical protein